MTGVYVWAVLKWATAFENPTALTTFRSWKVNFVAFWVYIGATFLNIIFANNFSGNLFVMSGMSLVIYSAYIGIGLGAPLVGAGIFLSWRIKQIWITYDPERSLAFQPFDYFIWEDEEPEEDPEDNEKTQIDDNTGDNTGDDTKTEGSDRLTIPTPVRRPTPKMVAPIMATTTAHQPLPQAVPAQQVTAPREAARQAAVPRKAARQAAALRVVEIQIKARQRMTIQNRPRQPTEPAKPKEGERDPPLCSPLTLKGSQ